MIIILAIIPRRMEGMLEVMIIEITKVLVTMTKIVTIIKMNYKRNSLERKKSGILSKTIQVNENK